MAAGSCRRCTAALRPRRSGARQFVLLAEDLADDLERLFNGGGCTRWELMADGRWAFFGSQKLLSTAPMPRRAASRHRSCESPCRGRASSTSGGVTLSNSSFSRNHRKIGGCEILRQVNGTKDQLQESEARVLHIAAPSVPAAPSTAEALRAVGEFDEQFLDLARKVSNRASRRPSGKRSPPR